LPFKPGVISFAEKTGAPIIPFAMDSTFKFRCRPVIKFGKPIYITENDDLLKKLEEYKEVISTMRYELIEEKGINSRSEISNTDYINYLKGSYTYVKK